MHFYALFRHDPQMVALAAGSSLFVEGDPSDFMYVLIKGRARVLLGDMVMDELEPGAIVGEMALIDHEPRSATVVAETDCEFACVDEKRFRFLVSETPGFALEVMHTLAQRLRGTNHLLTDHHAKTLQTLAS
jgi:CRP/FNR family cyclic AMP-dependent transcriptional regulator